MTDADPSKPKSRGRPAIGKRGSFTFRVSERVRSLLTEAAQQEHRSVSEEIEHRLERSFEMNDRLDRMMNETVWNVMELIKANKGKAIDLDFTIALIDSISRAEREARGINSQTLREDFPHFITGLYKATPEPGHKSSQLDDEAEREASQDKAPTPVAAPEEQAAWEPLMEATPNSDEPAQDGQPAKGRRKKPLAE